MVFRFHGQEFNRTANYKRADEIHLLHLQSRRIDGHTDLSERTYHHLRAQRGFPARFGRRWDQRHKLRYRRCLRSPGCTQFSNPGLHRGFAGIQLNDTYNTRLQPNELKAWSTAGVAMDLVYGFVDGNGKNNGNVVQVTNNKDTTRSQQFTYDQLNRILTAKTTATSGTNCWSYTYGIDVWANLNSAQPITGYSCTQSNLSLGISTNNRITNTGVSYDASGNTLTDGLNTYTWDAESQIKAAAGVNYTYDGDGNRLQKSNGKIYWFGAGSEVLDESDASGSITDEYVFFGGKRVAHRAVSSGAIYYYAEDLLGSSRVITTATGSVCYDADFLPFGGEHVITNTCPQNYKFTGKERDAETGNDDFGARYFSPSLGRWLSPDWSAIPAPVPYAQLTNPQTLNLYAYVNNNPETFADVDGHLWPIGVQDPSISPQSNSDNLDYLAMGATMADSYAGSAEYQNQLQQQQGQAQQTQQQAQQEQGQSSGCGWCQKLVNGLRGSGWKTDQQIAKEAIDRGEPPNGEYSFLSGKSCPDCKYYPREVVEAVNAHEDQHARDEHTTSGFGKLFTKAGRRELEVRAFKAELSVEQRNIKALEGKGSARTPTDEKSLIILRNMRDQANGVIKAPDVYIP